MNIFYLGPIGTFSYHVASRLYPDDNIIAVDSFSKIFNKLTSDKNALGILPVENSTSSNVHENIDYLFSGKYNIRKETYLKICLNLYGVNNAKLNNIKEIFSHPKALEQCSDFIKTNSLKATAVESTAKAIELIKEEKNTALGAIGNPINTEEVNKIEESIGNEEFNLTRFLHVSKNTLSDFNEVKGNKLSIVFKLPHIEGALAKTLTEIANLKINLSKIESKPIPGSKFEYLFWIDLEMNNEEVYTELLNVLNKTTKDAQIVGRYNSGDILD